MYKNIQEILATLSPEEREQHAVLIFECLVREKELNKIASFRQTTIDGLINSATKLFQELDNVSRSAKQALEIAQKIFDQTRRVQLIKQKPVGSA